MGLWNAPLDLKSADFSVHFGNHFVNTKSKTWKWKYFTIHDFKLLLRIIMPLTTQNRRNQTVFVLQKTLWIKVTRDVQTKKFWCDKVPWQESFGISTIRNERIFQFVFRHEEIWWESNDLPRHLQRRPHRLYRLNNS